MSALTRGQRHAARALLAAVTVVLCMTGLAPSRPAQALTLGVPATMSAQAVVVAAQQIGKPYVYGASGPAAFDCSGLTSYVYRTRLHRYVPRTAQQQYDAAIHIARSQIRPGDLVFFYSGSLRNIYHVGIYAGGGKIWHAPHTGAWVRLATIWTNLWVAGRVA